MPRHDLTDQLDVRLRDSRPDDVDVDPDAFDADLLARVRSTPIAARTVARRPIVLPVVAGVTVLATVAVMFIGGPGGTGGPSSADAITQTLHWLDPPDGTILHVKSVETMPGQTLTREFWQSADDSAVQREVYQGAENFELAGEAFYDPATNTIYDAPKGRLDLSPDQRAKVADAAKADAVKAAKLQADGLAPSGDRAVEPAKRTDVQQNKAAATPVAGKPGEESLPVGDPIVVKVGMLLEGGRMTVTGRELHDGIEAWAVSLRPGQGEAPWTLWVSAADGKPLELRDPGGNGKDGQVIRWSTYEVLPGDSAAKSQLTLTGAHPDATVVRDPAQVDAARARIWPGHR